MARLATSNRNIWSGRRRKEGKWDEICYIDMLFILEGKGMELSWTLTEPLVLVLKYRLEKDKGSVKRVAEGVKGVACSI